MTGIHGEVLIFQPLHSQTPISPVSPLKPIADKRRDTLINEEGMRHPDKRVWLHSVYRYVGECVIICDLESGITVEG